MTNIPIQFIKKKFASVAAAQTYSDQDGRIVFDKKNHVLCVDGDVYGGI